MTDPQGGHELVALDHGAGVDEHRLGAVQDEGVDGECCPNPGMGTVDVTTSMSGAAL